jgi:hypothetical protein
MPNSIIPPGGKDIKQKSSSRKGKVHGSVINFSAYVSSLTRLFFFLFLSLLFGLRAIFFF